MQIDPSWACRSRSRCTCCSCASASRGLFRTRRVAALNVAAIAASCLLKPIRHSFPRRKFFRFPAKDHQVFLNRTVLPVANAGRHPVRDRLSSLFASGYTSAVPFLRCLKDSQTGVGSSMKTREIHRNAAWLPGLAAVLVMAGCASTQSVPPSDTLAGQPSPSSQPPLRRRPHAAGADSRRAEVRREARRHADGHCVRERLQRGRPAHLEQAGRERQAAHGAGAAHRQAAAIARAVRPARRWPHRRRRAMARRATRQLRRPSRRARATVRSSRKRSGMRAASRSSGPRAARSSTASGLAEPRHPDRRPAGRPGAPADGRVMYAGTGLNDYGSLIIVQHNADFLTAYAHNRKLLVKTGDIVPRRDRRDGRPRQLACRAAVRSDATASRSIRCRTCLRRKGEAGPFRWNVAAVAATLGSVHASPALRGPTVVFREARRRPSRAGRRRDRVRCFTACPSCFVPPIPTEPTTFMEHSPTRRSLLLAAVAAPFVAACTSAPVADRRAHTAQAELTALEKASNGRLGVAALDTSNGVRIAHHARERFPSGTAVAAAAAMLARGSLDASLLPRRILYRRYEIVAACRSRKATSTRA